MCSSSGDVYKTAARAARLNPSADLKSAAVSAGIEVGALIGHLRELPPRGRCAFVAAEAAISARRELRAVGLSHPACPRGVLRAAATLRPKSLSAAGAGTAAWAQRRGVDTPRPRVGATRDAAVAVSHVRRVDAWGDPRTPPAVLAGCARDPFGAGVAVIAMNPSADMHLLECFASHPDDQVRFCVAQNPACGSRVLRRLAADVEDEIRNEVASHPNCSTDTLRVLAADSDPLTRMGVARHTRCPNDLLAVLAADNYPPVRAATAERDDLCDQLRDQLAGDDDWQVAAATANRPGCAEHLLRGLAESDTTYTQICVARHQSTPGDVLTRLASHTDEEVRAAVASNKSAAMDLLDQLSGDDSAEVRAHLIDNPVCDRQLAERLSINDDPDAHLSHRRDGCVQGLLAAVNNPTPSRQDQIQLAEHPQCPPGQIKELAAVSMSAVRRAVARNPTVDALMLIGLVNDDDPTVAAAAVRRLRQRWSR